MALFICTLFCLGAAALPKEADMLPNTNEWTIDLTQCKFEYLIDFKSEPKTDDWKAAFLSVVKPVIPTECPPEYVPSCEISKRLFFWKGTEPNGLSSPFPSPCGEDFRDQQTNTLNTIELALEILDLKRLSNLWGYSDDWKFVSLKYLQDSQTLIMLFDGGFVISMLKTGEEGKIYFHRGLMARKTFRWNHILTAAKITEIFNSLENKLIPFIKNPYEQDGNDTGIEDRYNLAEVEGFSGNNLIRLKCLDELRGKTDGNQAAGLIDRTDDKSLHNLKNYRFPADRSIPSSFGFAKGKPKDKDTRQRMFWVCNAISHHMTQVEQELNLPVQWKGRGDDSTRLSYGQVEVLEDGTFTIDAYGRAAVEKEGYDCKIMFKFTQGREPAPPTSDEIIRVIPLVFKNRCPDPKEINRTEDTSLNPSSSTGYVKRIKESGFINQELRTTLVCEFPDVKITYVSESRGSDNPVFYQRSFAGMLKDGYRKTSEYFSSSITPSVQPAPTSNIEQSVRYKYCRVLRMWFNSFAQRLLSAESGEI